MNPTSSIESNDAEASQSGPSAQAPVHIPLKRLPLWTLGLTVLSAVTMAFSLSTVTDLSPKWMAGRPLSTMDWLGIASSGMWFVLWLSALTKRAVVRQFAFGPIVLGDNSMQLPSSPEGIRTHTLAYSDITSVIEGGSRHGRHFFIESTKKVFHLPQRAFASEEGADLLLRELRNRLSALPEGPKRLVETELRRRATLAAMNQRAWVTQTLLGVCAVFFLNTWLKGALDSPFGLLRWGANAQALVLQGEWWRIFAANFLHGFWLHAGMNALALWYMGQLLERLLGSARFALLYLVSGALAMTASCFLGHAIMSVGASGAIFGLLGGFAVVSWRLRELLPLGFRQSTRWWFMMIAINLVLPILWPTIDLTAHLTGFTVGAVLTLVFVGRRRSLPRPANKPLSACAIAVSTLFFVALGQAVVHAADTTASQEIEVSQLLLADPRSDANHLNALAWRWVIDPDSQPEHLEAALATAQEAVRREPLTPEFRSTVAALARRLGHYDAAIESWRLGLEAAHIEDIEEGAIVASQTVSAAYATQLVKTFELRQSSSKPGVSKADLPHARGMLRRHGNSWTLEPRPVTEAKALPWYAVARDKRHRPVALLRYVPDIDDAPPWTLPEPLIKALGEANASETDPVWQPSAWPFPKPLGKDDFALWRLTYQPDDED